MNHSWKKKKIFMTLPFIRPLWGCHLQLHVELSGEKSSSVLFSRGGGGGEGASVAFVKGGLGNRTLFFHLQQGQIKVTLTVTGSFASTPSLIALWHNCFFACRKVWRLNKGSKQERWKKVVRIVHTNYPLPIPYFRWREKPCLWNRFKTPNTACLVK